MARIKQSTIDAAITEVRLVFGATGIGVAVKFIEQEFNEAGNLVRQEPEREEIIDPADLTVAQRASLETLATRIKTNWLARRYT